MANSVDPDKTVSYGSALFAQVPVLVCRAERFNEICAYIAFDIFRKIVFCVSLYSEEEILQNVVSDLPFVVILMH